MLPISMGNLNFKKIREEGYYYDDKSLKVRELIQDGARVVLLARPRRFGKTLNLTCAKPSLAIVNQTASSYLGESF